MQRAKLRLLIALALVLCSTPGFAQKTPDEPLPAQAGRLLIHKSHLVDRTPGATESFIVALTTDASQIQQVAEDLRRDYEIVVQKTWTQALVGLLVECDLATAKALANDARVRYVEQNVSSPPPSLTVGVGRSASQGNSAGPPDCFDLNATDFDLDPYPDSTSTISWGADCPNASSCIGNWGLDRIDSRLGLDESYQPMLAGPDEVDVFIIDTTVLLTHEELNQFPTDEFFVGTGPAPIHGHATHVAGIVAGKNFGVAHDVVRFKSVSFGGTGSVDIAFIIEGFETVLENRRIGVPTVISLSYNNPAFPTSLCMLEVVRRLTVEGVLIVNSAGNIQGPSCAEASKPEHQAENFTLTGPAYPPEVLIVGATDDEDRLYCDCDGPSNSISPHCGSRISNEGAIDLFAPGADIVSMAIDNPQAICRLSGTSMAAPHVAGAAALLLSRFPEASPRAIQRALKKMATQNIVRDHQGNLVNSGRLLYVGDGYSSDKPIGGQKWYFAEAGEKLIIPKADLVRSSFDWGHQPLQLTSVFAPRNGQLRDLGSTIEFTVDADAPPPALTAPSSASFRFEVSNGVKEDRGKVQIIIPNQPPTAHITVRGDNLDRTFDGRASTDDKGIVNYSWIFPGGVVKTGPVVDHFFEGYPPFSTSVNVRLTVTDTNGVTATVLESVQLPQPNITPQQGMWYNPERSGNRFTLYANSFEQYVFTWYTYLADGTPIWYISDAVPKGLARWSATVHKMTRNGSSTSTPSTTSTPFGIVTLSFNNAYDCWLKWEINGQEGGERFRFLHGIGGTSGLWHPSSETESGWGLTVTDSISGHAMMNTVTFYDGSEPRWVQGQVPYSPNAEVPVYWHEGPDLCPTCEGSTRPTLTPAGSIRVEIPSQDSLTGHLSTDIEIVQPRFVITWDRPRLPIAVLAGPPRP